MVKFATNHNDVMKKIALGLLLIGAGFWAEAQEVWTLSKCIEYALQNNIQVKQSLLSAELAKENYEQSIANLLPSLNAGASHSYNWGQRIDPFTNQFATNRVRSNNFGLSSSVTVFNGFQLNNTMKKNNLDFMASRYDVEKMQNDIALNISTAYLQILFAQELLGVAKNQLQITQNQLERTEKLVKAEVLPEGNLLDLQAQISSDELQIVTAENQLDLAYLNLKQLMDYKGTGEFKVEKPIVDVPADALAALTPEQIFSSAVNTQPEIKSAETQILSADKSLSIAKGTASPSLTLTGSIGTGYSGLSQTVTGYEVGDPTIIGATADSTLVYGLQNSITPLYEKTPFGDQLDQNFNQNLSLNLNIPIFNGWQSRTAIARAKINRQSSELALEASKNQLQYTIQQAHADAKAALKQYNASLRTVEALNQSLEYAQKRFDVGLLNATDFNETKTRLASAQSDMLRAKYDYIFKLKVLDFYQGKPITLK